MKRNTILSFLIGICQIAAFGQHHFALKFISHTLVGKKVYLTIFNNRNYIPIQKDSFIVRDGYFEITGNVKQPSNFAALYVANEDKYISPDFLLDSGNNDVSLELPKIQSRFLILTSNSKSNYIHNELKKIPGDKIDGYSKPLRHADGRLIMTEELQQRMIEMTLNVLQKYPNDFASLIELCKVSRLNDRPDDAEKVLTTLATFSNDLRNSTIGKQLYTEETGLINNKTASNHGNPVPIFNVRDINNVPFTNATLKGQNYMIVFSATWCGPCQKQLPKLKKIYNLYKSKGLKIIYFNNDDNVTRWKEHVSLNKLDWINVSERLKPSESKIQKSFGVYAIPTCLIINRQGMIVYNSDQMDPNLTDLEKYLRLIT